MSQACRHYDEDELQPDYVLKRLAQWVPSVKPRLVVADEVRQYKVLNTVGDFDEVTVGTARYPRKVLGEPVSPRVMPSQADRPILMVRIENDEVEVEHVRFPRARLSCTKWERMVPAKSGSGRSRASVVNMSALKDVLADLK